MQYYHNQETTTYQPQDSELLTFFVKGNYYEVHHNKKNIKIQSPYARHFRIDFLGCGTGPKFEEPTDGNLPKRPETPRVTPKVPIVNQPAKPHFNLQDVISKYLFPISLGLLIILILILLYLIYQLHQKYKSPEWSKIDFRKQEKSNKSCFRCCIPPSTSYTFTEHKNLLTQTKATLKSCLFHNSTSDLQSNSELSSSTSLSLSGNKLIISEPMMVNLNNCQSKNNQAYVNQSTSESTLNSDNLDNSRDSTVLIHQNKNTASSSSIQNLVAPPSAPLPPAPPPISTAPIPPAPPLPVIIHQTSKKSQKRLAPPPPQRDCPYPINIEKIEIISEDFAAVNLNLNKKKIPPDLPKIAKPPVMHFSKISVDLIKHASPSKQSANSHLSNTTCHSTKTSFKNLRTTNLNKNIKPNKNSKNKNNNNNHHTHTSTAATRLLNKTRSINNKSEPKIKNSNQGKTTVDANSSKAAGKYTPKNTRLHVTNASSKISSSTTNNYNNNTQIQLPKQNNNKNNNNKIMNKTSSSTKLLTEKFEALDHQAKLESASLESKPKNLLKVNQNDNNMQTSVQKSTYKPGVLPKPVASKKLKKSRVEKPRWQ